MEALVKTTFRQCIENKQQIFYDPVNKKIIMGEASFDRDIPIRLTIKDAKHALERDYSIYDVWFLCAHGKDVKTYFSSAKENDARFVSYLHRRYIAEELLPLDAQGKRELQSVFNSDLFKLVAKSAEDEVDQLRPPAVKRRKIEITQERRDEWKNYLHQYDEKELGTDRITDHWSAKDNGVPPLDTKWVELVDADNETWRFMQTKQDMVTRQESMQVLPTAKDTNANFFKEVLHNVHTARKTHLKQHPGLPPTPSIEQREANFTSRTRLYPTAPISLKMADQEEPVMLPKMKPIIIVPAASSSLITLWNVQTLLQDGRYQSTQHMKLALKEKPKSLTVNCSKFIKKDEMEKMKLIHRDFRVIDNPECLKPVEWDFVTCAFVTGVQWQFSDWFAEDPVTIFDSIRGYHLTFAEDQPHPVTSKWKVKRLMVSKSEEKRYKDKLTIREFWLDLARTTLRHKPQFMRDYK